MCFNYMVFVDLVRSKLYVRLIELERSFEGE